MTRIYVDVKDPGDAEILYNALDNSLVPYRIMRAGKEAMEVKRVVINSEHERDWPTMEDDMKEDV